MKIVRCSMGLTSSLVGLDHSLAEAGESFGKDLGFLRRHTEVVVLSGESGQAQVAVAPQWQGRVMTSTAGGLDGTSFGWVNRQLIESRQVQPHINVFGGEDRFWLGPEGGQFSLFFSKGASFDLDHWFTPASLDTEPFQVLSQTAQSVVCGRNIQLANHSGTRFTLDVNREVRLLQSVRALGSLGVSVPSGLKAVAFESVNTVKNTGPVPWQKDSGLVSLWILGMFNASPDTTIVLPFEKGDEAVRGPVVNDAYFGKVPADRLIVGDGVVFFRGDAAFRSKIGLPPRRAKSLMGSYDANSRTLTLVHFTLPAGAVDYVNSMWEIQKNPFGGDVSNSYNDGAPKPGAKGLGRFFELESSSPALALQPGASATHVHQTFHLQGSEAQLDAIARVALGTGLEQIKHAFKK